MGIEVKDELEQELRDLVSKLVDEQQLASKDAPVELSPELYAQIKEEVREELRLEEETKKLEARLSSTGPCPLCLSYSGQPISKRRMKIWKQGLRTSEDKDAWWMSANRNEESL